MLPSSFDLRRDFDLFMMQFNADLKQRHKKRQTLNKDHNKPAMRYMIVLCQNGFTLIFVLHGTAVIMGN